MIRVPAVGGFGWIISHARQMGQVRLSLQYFQASKGRS